MSPQKKDTIHIGLCMAGAISAGAYTAGVIDYLFETLDKWEAQRGQPNIPEHRVVISVMGGASAGGMTSIVAASSMNNHIEPVKIDPGNLFAEQPNNKFYHSWVDLTSDDMLNLMLSNTDIINDRAISLLNSSFIDSIGQRMIIVDKENWIDRNYINPNLKLFATLSNLKGFPYDVQFKSNSSAADKYLASYHADYACFVLNKEENDYNNDGWIPLNFRTGTNANMAKDAAMATGAFPIGLASRKVVRKNKYIKDNEWLPWIVREHFPETGDNHSLFIDGGLINNEPFERVKELLARMEGTVKSQDYKDFNQTVIMIDPFPSEIKEEYKGEDDILSVASQGSTTIFDQLRVKYSIFEEAFDSDNAGQYLIAPSVYRPDEKGNIKRFQGSKAIACGTFGGFGGFINKKFRIHDYFLGRANCEKFLRDHFTVPVKVQNKIIEAGYKNVQNRSPYISQTDKEEGLQIIPVLDERKENIFMPDFGNGMIWPVMKNDELKNYKKAIKNRADAVIKASFKGNTLLWMIRKLYLNKKISNLVLEKVEKSLEEHCLLK